MSWGDAAQANIFCGPRGGVPQLDKHNQAPPDPIVLRVPSQGKVKTTGQGGEGGHSAPFRFLFHSPNHSCHSQHTSWNEYIPYE